MKDSLTKLDGKPEWKIILHGAAVPGKIAAVCAAIGVGYAWFKGYDLVSAAKWGAGIGLVLSIIGAVEVVAGLLIHSNNIRTNLLLVFGYLLAWSICYGTIFS